MRIQRFRFTNAFSVAFVYASPLECVAIMLRMRKQRNIFHADSYMLPGIVIRTAARVRGAQFVMFTKRSGFKH